MPKSPTDAPTTDAPASTEAQPAQVLVNAKDWDFNEHQFNADEPFVNPGIEQKYIDRAIQDGLLRNK